MGWNQVMKGRLIKKWGHAQSAYYIFILEVSHQECVVKGHHIITVGYELGDVGRPLYFFTWKDEG